MARWKYGLGQVIEAMDAAIGESPDRKDESAGSGLGGRYVRHGEPCCLAGVIMDRLGVQVKTLKELDREGEQIPRSDHLFWGRFQPEALELLSFLQGQNDAGRTWGQARTLAFRVEKRWFEEGPDSPYYHRAFPGPWCTAETYRTTTKY